MWSTCCEYHYDDHVLTVLTHSDTRRRSPGLAASTHHRHPEEGGASVPAFGGDWLLPLGRAVGREFLLAHRLIPAPVIIRRLGMDHLGERQVELLVEQLEAGERAGHQARAVIAAPARDDLLLLRPAEDVVRSEEHTSELPSLMRNSYAVFCLNKNRTR